MLLAALFSLTITEQDWMNTFAGRVGRRKRQGKQKKVQIKKMFS